MSEQLPKGWCITSLSSLVTPQGVMVDGDWVESKDQDPNGNVRLIQLADVGSGVFLDKSNRWLTAERAVKLNCTFLETGDLLISRLGDPLGKTCLFPSLESQCVTVVDVHVFRSASPDISHRWLMHALNSHSVRAEVESQSSGTTRKRITGQKLKDLEIPLPPAQEQKRIASRIDELFSSIQEGEWALERVRKLVERYRQSVLKAAVTGELTRVWRERHAGGPESGKALLTRILENRRNAWENSELIKMKSRGQRPINDQWKKKYEDPVGPDPDGLPEPPSGWTWASLDQLTSKVTSGSRDWKDYYGRGNRVFVMAQNVRMRRLDLSEVQLVDPPEGDRDAARSEIAKDDLLITIVGANTGDVCNVPEPLKQHYVCQSVALIRPVSGQTSSFMELYLSADEGGQLQFSKGFYGAGRPHLSFDQLKATCIPLPGLLEQKQITDALKVVESDIAAMEGALTFSIRQATLLRRSTLWAAFSGRLVPQDPNDEPASVLLARIAAQCSGSRKRARATFARKKKVKV